MGTFEAGTQGAFRFEVQGIVDGHPRLVVEHVTRIDDDCAPEWPTSTAPGGIHRVRISGHPNLDVTIHGTEPGEPGAAGGGNATAANRIVNAIPGLRRTRGPTQRPRSPADHRRRGATPLTAPAAARALYRPGSPPSRRR